MIRRKPLTLPEHVSCISDFRATKQPGDLSLAPNDESRQHFSAAIDPSAQLRCGGRPVPLIDAPPQRRRLQPPRPEVEGEIDDGSESPLWFSCQHRAVAQRRCQRRLQIARQIDLSLCLRDRWVLGITEMAVADRPEASGTDVGNGGDLDSALHPAFESLEALRQIDGGLRHRHHGRTRSNTRPRNQKFSTPAHSA